MNTALARSQVESVNEAPSNYCGLFCVYAVAKERGREVRFESLIDRDLLTGRYGSSVGNIIEALDRCGVQGYPKAGMTIEQLTTLTKPALLHVAVPTVGNAYRHWVLYLGRDESGKLRIYDPPRSQGTLSEAELLSIWDGVAVMTEPPSAGTYIPDVSFIGMTFLTAVSAVFLGRRMSSGKLIFSLVVGVSVLAGLTPGSGILSSPLAVGSVQARFFEASFPEADFATLQEKMSRPHVLIDARTQKAFSHDHIPGAINVPVNSGLMGFCRTAETLTSETPVIVYCQGHACKWGDQVARQLQGRGVRNIMIYRGGMNEWASQEH